MTKESKPEVNVGDGNILLDGSGNPLNIGGLTLQYGTFPMHDLSGNLVYDISGNQVMRSYYYCDGNPSLANENKPIVVMLHGNALQPSMFFIDRVDINPEITLGSALPFWYNKEINKVAGFSYDWSDRAGGRPDHPPEHFKLENLIESNGRDYFYVFPAAIINQYFCYSWIHGDEDRDKPWYK